MKILIGYDGSESADEVFADLKTAGLPSDTEAIVASVGDLLMIPPGEMEDFESVIPSRRVASALKKMEVHTEKVIKETQELAEKGKNQVQELFPDWKISSKAFSGTPEWVLIDIAKKMNVDLVFVGSQGRSAIGRFILGSVSKRIATDAHCSVRVARRGKRDHTDTSPPRIIVGVDGSPAAEQAIYAIGQRVWQDGTEVRLVTANDSTSTSKISVTLPRATAMIESYLQNSANRVSEMLKWGTEELSNIGLKTSIVQTTGDPKTLLLAEAKKWNADSIFVGTRDFKNAFERFRLGSVSTGVLTDAHCSVEVVRPPDSLSS